MPVCGKCYLMLEERDYWAHRLEHISKNIAAVVYDALMRMQPVEPPEPAPTTGLRRRIIPK